MDGHGDMATRSRWIFFTSPEASLLLTVILVVMFFLAAWAEIIRDQIVALPT